MNCICAPFELWTLSSQILSQEMLRLKTNCERKNENYGISKGNVIEIQELLFQMPCDGLKLFFLREI